MHEGTTYAQVFPFRKYFHFEIFFFFFNLFLSFNMFLSKQTVVLECKQKKFLTRSSLHNGGDICNSVQVEILQDLMSII